ncbi:MAG: acyl carrier protein [Pseudodesulfovibrio sp.]|nr:acyl carrier protein [Pseudodesulfovibrio sp.]
MTANETAITQLLSDEFGLADMELDAPIFSAKVLDSMDVLRLMILLEQEFGTKIPVFEVSLEMFDTVRSIAVIVEQYS